MPRRSAAFLSTLLLVTCGEHGHDGTPSTVPLDGIGREALFVVNGSDAPLSVIDPATDAYIEVATGTVVETVPVGSKPNGMAVRGT